MPIFKYQGGKAMGPKPVSFQYDICGCCVWWLGVDLNIDKLKCLKFLRLAFALSCVVVKSWFKFLRSLSVAIRVSCYQESYIVSV